MEFGFTKASILANVPMGVEMLPQPAVLPRPGVSQYWVAFPRGAQVTVSEALRRLQSAAPGYEVTVIDGVVNVAPALLLHDPGDALNRPIERLAVPSMPLRDAVTAVWSMGRPGQGDRACRPFFGGGGTGGRSDALTRRRMSRRRQRLVGNVGL
jgi:hypothetical protein